MIGASQGPSYSIPAESYHEFHAFAGREGRWRLRRSGTTVSLRIGRPIYDIVGQNHRGDLVMRMALTPGPVIGGYDYDAEIGLTDDRVAGSCVTEIIRLIEEFGGERVADDLALAPAVLPAKPKPRPRRPKVKQIGHAPAPMPRIDGHLPAATLFADDARIVGVVRRMSARMGDVFEEIEWRHERLAAGRTVDDVHAALETVGLAPRSLVSLRTAHDNAALDYAARLRQATT